MARIRFKLSRNFILNCMSSEAAESGIALLDILEQYAKADKAGRAQLHRGLTETLSPFIAYMGAQSDFRYNRTYLLLKAEEYWSCIETLSAYIDFAAAHFTDLYGSLRECSHVAQRIEYDAFIRWERDGVRPLQKEFSVVPGWEGRVWNLRPNAARIKVTCMQGVKWRVFNVSEKENRVEDICKSLTVSKGHEKSI